MPARKEFVALAARLGGDHPKMLKRTGEGEITGARKVTLISSDNQCFELTIKAALGSGLLKEMLDDEAGQNFEIPLPS